MNAKEKHHQILSILAKKIKNHKSIVECGVKYGDSAVVLLKQINGRGYLFDTWEGFPGVSAQDTPTLHRAKKAKRSTNTPRYKKYCIKKLAKNKVYARCDLIEGDICKTVGKFVKSHKNIEISFLHIDTDIYQPCKVSLEQFAPMVSEEGFIFVHDYGSSNWPGVKIAVDEYCVKNPNWIMTDLSALGIKAVVLSKQNLSVNELVVDKI